MTPTESETLLAAAVLAVMLLGIPPTLRLMHAVVDARPLWEPEWKREARQLSRYVPTGDEWGR